MKTINISRGNLSEYTDRQGADQSPRCPICGEDLRGPVAYYIDDCITPFCDSECANAAAREAEAFGREAELSDACGQVRVNVWFGAENTASVFEDFETFEQALAFAHLYGEEEYPDVKIKIFNADGSIFDARTGKFCTPCHLLPKRCGAPGRCYLTALAEGSSGCGYAY